MKPESQESYWKQKMNLRGGLVELLSLTYFVVELGSKSKALASSGCKYMLLVSAKGSLGILATFTFSVFEVEGVAVVEVAEGRFDIAGKLCVSGASRV